jgi:hypothetical protein
MRGTKCAPHYQFTILPGETRQLRLVDFSSNLMGQRGWLSIA